MNSLASESYPLISRIPFCCLCGLLLLGFLSGCSEEAPPQEMIRSWPGSEVIENCLGDIGWEIESLYDDVFGSLHPSYEEYEFSGTTKEDFELEYTWSFQKGLISDSKLDGPVFEEGGCDIGLHVRFPAGKEDLNQLASTVIQLDNGISYRWRDIVRAEDTERGRKFVKDVNRIIKDGLKGMNKRLEQF